MRNRRGIRFASDAASEMNLTPFLPDPDARIPFKGDGKPGGDGVNPEHLARIPISDGDKPKQGDGKPKRDDGIPSTDAGKAIRDVANPLMDAGKPHGDAANLVRYGK
jgi:hypothetical protein